MHYRKQQANKSIIYAHCVHRTPALLAVYGSVGVTVNAENPGSARLRILNVLGEAVFIREFSTFTRGRNTVWFDAPALKRGIYAYNADVDGVPPRVKIERIR